VQLEVHAKARCHRRRRNRSQCSGGDHRARIAAVRVQPIKVYDGYAEYDHPSTLGLGVFIHRDVNEQIVTIDAGAAGARPREGLAALLDGGLGVRRRVLV
jgi:hypothetical protein